MKTGIEYIAEERQRQIEVKGYTIESDDKYHGSMDLLWAAVSYILWQCSRTIAIKFWPWSQQSFKPCTFVHDLSKAGALIAAEIDRHNRMVLGVATSVNKVVK